MKVKDIISTQTDLGNIGGDKVVFVVKPQGTKKQYYNSENNQLRNEIAEMDVKTWFIAGTKKKYCEFVIIVERNKEYEAKREKAWQDLINR